MTNDRLLAFFNLTLKHKFMIDVFFDVIKDQSILLEKLLQRCSIEGCTVAATVSICDNVMCDHHAARAVVEKRLAIDDAELSQHVSDLSNAVIVRRLTNFVDMLQQEDVIQSDRARYH